MVLVHAAALRSSQRRRQNRGWLHRRKRGGCKLPKSFGPPDEASRGDPGDVRSGANFLRSVARHFLAANQPNPGGRTISRHWPKLPGGNLLWQRRGEETRRSVKGEIEQIGQVSETDRDGNSSRDEFLSRGRVSPEILPQEPDGF